MDLMAASLVRTQLSPCLIPESTATRYCIQRLMISSFKIVTLEERLKCPAFLNDLTASGCEEFNCIDRDVRVPNTSPASVVSGR